MPLTNSDNPKPGTSVICTNAHGAPNLTPSKSYRVETKPEGMSHLSDTVFIVNDAGEMAGVFKWRFDQDPAPPHARPADDLYVEIVGPRVTFRLQDGPIREVGVNGCQIDDVVAFALAKVEEFNKLAPCVENHQVAVKLKEALYWLEERKRQREKRGVEGTSRA